MKIEIKSFLTGSILFEGDFSCLSEAVTAAVKARAYLSGANLSGANLSRAYLSGADLSGADLSGAYLSGADLSRADLSRAYLSGADLRGADLSGAHLSGAHLSGFAQIAFKGHGECGRMLTAIRQVADGPVLFQCGCFLGSEPELRAFIAGDEPEMVRSRILALDTVLVLLNS